MFYAILASLMTYFYLQWPTLLSLLSIITWSSVVFFCLLYHSGIFDYGR